MTNYCVFLACISFVANQSPIVQQSKAESKVMLLKQRCAGHCSPHAWRSRKVERWYHLVDSQAVLGAVQRESHDYWTFFANSIGEIQSSTRTQDWWWILGPQNTADIITRGASPQDLQLGEWPIKSAKEIATIARESINKLQQTAFVAVRTRVKGEEQEPRQTEQRRPQPSRTLRMSRGSFFF